MKNLNTTWRNCKFQQTEEQTQGSLVFLERVDTTFKVALQGHVFQFFVSEIFLL